MNDKDALHRQLIRLGDMMGDGEHHEKGGAWISREYKATLKALGILPKRKRNPANTEAIVKRMSERVAVFKCPKCGGDLKQTKKGSMRAACTACKAKFQLLKRGKA